MEKRGRFLVGALLLLCCTLAWLGPLDRLAQAHAEEGLKRAVASFAAARALNAAISVLQGTEVSGGVVVGIKLAPGQVLDPVNDLVEQFSLLMLAASLAFGVQLLLMKMGASWGLAALLSGVAALWLWRVGRGQAAPGLGRLLGALLLVRFVVPVAALTGELAFQGFMAADYRNAQAGIERSVAALGLLEAAQEADAPRWWAVRERIDALKAAGERIVEDSLRVATVFLVQTLLLPLLTVWGLWQGLRGLLSAPGREGQPMRPAR